MFPILDRTPFAVLIVPFALLFIAQLSAALWHFPRRIVVTDESMFARNYVGLSKRLRWNDVAMIERSTRTSFHFHELVRVTDGRRGGSIIFTDAISDFSELMRLIASSAPAARNIRMSWRWRLLFL